MILDTLLHNVDIVESIGDLNINIEKIHFDSRKINNNDVFVALIGLEDDGHDYIEQAISSGAKVILCVNKPKDIVANIVYVIVDNSHKALAVMSSNYFDNPSGKLKLIGVTGTNGKTSVVNLLHQLFTLLNYKCGLISTIENINVNQKIRSTHTTPDPIQINLLLSQMVESGCEYCFMEVSSHALSQKRVDYLNFALGTFTNISHDHLDYHKSFESYLNAKKSFFDNLNNTAFSLVNNDDKHALIMLQNSKAIRHTFSLKKVSDFKCKIIENDFDGMLLHIDNNDVWVKLVGEFNAYNLLAVYSIAKLFKHSTKDILTAISMLNPAEGRFQSFKSSTGIIAVLDYAHTDDALKNVLSTINSIRKKNQKIITVFGCGGDRDRLKRPKMTSVACKLSSQVILTSDNPRSEDIAKIILDMTSELDDEYLKRTIIIHNRKQAIKTAFALAQNSDIVLIAGKGHEKYQEIEGEKNPFDDKEEILKLLNLN